MNNREDARAREMLCKLRLVVETELEGEIEVSGAAARCRMGILRSGATLREG